MPTVAQFAEMKSQKIRPGRDSFAIRPTHIVRSSEVRRTPLQRRLKPLKRLVADADENNLSVLRGSPPKGLWLQIGNCTTAQVEAVFRVRLADIEAFENDPSVGTLVLS